MTHSPDSQLSQHCLGAGGEFVVVVLLSLLFPFFGVSVSGLANKFQLIDPEPGESFMLPIKIVGVLAPVAVVILVAVVFWTLMWKFVLEPNPLIREFFDLDLKKNNKNTSSQPSQTPSDKKAL